MAIDQQRDWQRRADEAEAKAGPALVRLLELAEGGDSGQIPRIAKFLASIYNGEAFPLDPFELRSVDITISDDMLTCLDALRWARTDLHKLIPNGDRRLQDVIARWGLKWPEDS